jgi:hypothetical protein
MCDHASERPDGAINVRMREHEGLIKVGVSMPTEIRLLSSDFRENSGQLISALGEIDADKFHIFAVRWHG